MTESHIRGVEPKKPELAECTPWGSICIKCDNRPSSSGQSDVLSDSGYVGVGSDQEGLVLGCVQLGNIHYLVYLQYAFLSFFS